MRKMRNLTGEKFGRLLCMATLDERTRNGHVQWKCKCDCGKETTVTVGNLSTGNTKSCGCIENGKKTHGQSSTNLYKVWSSMKHRCSNPNDKSYAIYGGKGISVCDDWLSFQRFNNWAQESGYEAGLTLERANNNKNYCPENCTWIPKGKQSENTSRCKVITYGGRTMILMHWSKHLNVPYSLLQSRLKRGWSVEKTLTTPRLR